MVCRDRGRCLSALPAGGDFESQGPGGVGEGRLAADLSAAGFVNPTHALPGDPAGRPYRHAPHPGPMKRNAQREGCQMLVLLIIVGVVVIALLWGVAIYNGLVRLRALVKEGFSGITVQLRRRADLIPNLVSTVEGYATHEREVLTQVTAHRADAVQGGSVAATAQADMAMTGMLGRLMAVAEAYPRPQGRRQFPPAPGRADRGRGHAAERAALLQRHRPRPEHQDPVLPQRADRAADGLQRGGILHRHGRVDPDRAGGEVRRGEGLSRCACARSQRC